MKKHKILSALLAVIMIATVLVGCASEDSTAFAAEEPKDLASEGVELEIWSFVEAHLNYYQEMAERWNAENPDKQITLVPTFLDWSSMHDKLYTALVAGEGVPDLVDVEISKWPNFMNGEVQFLDLTDYIAPYKDDLVTNRLDIYSKDGTPYGVPSHVGATVIYYNVELLEEAGIDYTEIVTWADFEEALRTYKEATGNYMIYVETYGAYQFTTMMAQKGVDLIDENGMPELNKPEAIEIVELWRNWVDEDLVGYIPGGNADTPEGKAAVANGDIAANIYPLWYMNRYTDEMPNLAGKIAIAPVPVFDETSHKSVGLGGTGTVVYKDSENADLAAEFITWAKLSEEGSSALWTALGFDPVNTLVLQNEELVNDPENIFVSYFLTNPLDVLAEVQDDMFTVKTMQNSGVINDYLSATPWNRIYVSLEDPATVMDETQAELLSQSE